MEKYNPQKIERKWQRVWERSGIYWAKDGPKKRKSYILVEFPYPSGEGIHVGHCRPYIAFDAISRKKRMEGFNVLFPMGWDAFGLPTENYAVKTGIHPKVVTQKNTSFFKRQQKRLGLSFDWSREINTTDPEYYKWTQWIFLQLFKKGLAYKAKMPINWCPSCKIGLANEEVLEGSCERCGAKATKKEKEQWLLKITKYAERLIEDLDKVDYPEKVKTLQRDWIGKSEGILIKFPISPEGPRPLSSLKNGKAGKTKIHYNFLLVQKSTSIEGGACGAGNSQFSIEVFTTRPDTLFGCTYLVLAPEHPIIENYKSQITNYKHVEKYAKEAKRKTERERISEIKEKTGIEIKGIKAINPVNNREIPIWLADYVLLHYGTGAIMAVPSHDRRDWDFAKKYNLPIIDVIKPFNCLSAEPFSGAYEGEGILINSGRFDGMKSETAKERITEWLARLPTPDAAGYGGLVKKELAKKAVCYKLRDWVFSRQRYWGEPIPLIFCGKCGWIAVSEKDLPVKLPNVKDYKPTETGDSPLAKVKSWVEVKCPKCKGQAKRETDVMPNWAGSNWYYLAYLMRGAYDTELVERKEKGEMRTDSSASFQFPISKHKKAFKYWMPVDWYNGGMEHSTLHLLYSRFIYKFLWDIGAVPKSLGPEPYKKRTSHGVILGENGAKMSKSRGNAVTPEQIIEQYGADTLRVYEMFIGPFEETIVWDARGLKGAKRFLDTVWNIINTKSKCKIQNDKNLKKLLHKTIKKVGEDIENLRFNTAVSALMILVNEMSKQSQLFPKESLRDPSGQAITNCQLLLKLLAPFAPHLAEELWFRLNPKPYILNPKYSIHNQAWPKYNPKLIKEEMITLVIQVNGRVRDKIKVEADISEEKAKELVLKRERIKNWLKGEKIKKVIFVPNKLINVVV